MKFPYMKLVCMFSIFLYVCLASKIEIAPKIFLFFFSAVRNVSHCTKLYDKHFFIYENCMNRIFWSNREAIYYKNCSGMGRTDYEN